MQNLLDATRSQLVLNSGSSKPRVCKILNEQQIARALYKSELSKDSENPDLGNIEVRLNSLFITHSAKACTDGLREIVAGLATDNSIESMLNSEFEELKANGHFEASTGSPEWRKLARTLAGVQIEVIERQAERNRGDLSGIPKHALLIASTPVSSDSLAIRILDSASLRPLSELTSRNSRPVTSNR